jgi:hypothetical protein
MEMKKKHSDPVNKKESGTTDQPADRKRDYPMKQPGSLPLPSKRNIPVKPDINHDPTRLMPGVNEPEKIDPTRIAEPPESQPELT